MDTQTENTKHDKNRNRNWYLLAVAFISSIAMGVISIQYANAIDRKSNRQWCEVVITLDDTYRQTPPQTPAGQNIAREMKRMRHDFECDK